MKIGLHVEELNIEPCEIVVDLDQNVPPEILGGLSPGPAGEGDRAPQHRGTHRLPQAPPELLCFSDTDT